MAPSSRSAKTGASRRGHRRDPAPRQTAGHDGPGRDLSGGRVLRRGVRRAERAAVGLPPRAPDRRAARPGRVAAAQPASGPATTLPGHDGHRLRRWQPPRTDLSESLVGCAGLLNAARAGTVTLANAVGNGVSDDNQPTPTCRR
ncbi:MAG: hypothetical protein IT204_15180 [Fimbriimonadaceae bacterium]|nr:hypothetical protein [Fimbriimonadaceae bacterium]